ncbi:MAG: sigma-54 dependent transcriptional regulator [Desulfuromusa sp.]|jgi:DNA-binding NtrC family response regulator|nr:sigma-54 dependent transcriptional regulator [Desulfuromusa sp.]
MLDLSLQDPHVVLVDDEVPELEAYEFLLESMGVHRITAISDSREVLATLEKNDSPIVFLDLNMPHISGQDVLRLIKLKFPQIPVIVCTANSDIETAVECLKLGAHDYLVKPINLSTFGSALRTAHEINTLRSEVLSLKGISFQKQLSTDACFRNIMTKSSLMESIFHYIQAISQSRQPLLILGETGVGKELIAKAVHETSQLSGEFIPIDASGLDDTLFSDTLFGHEKGAYSSAEKPRSGLVETARNGTLFLDEIGDLNEGSQVKLLRLLQEGIYYPLGSDQPKKSEARIIAATNKSHHSLVEKNGGFRRDLYYRLSTHLIKVPPLRERREDIPLLVDLLMTEAAASMGKEKPDIGGRSLELLLDFPFYGNIRELKTYIFDAVARCDSKQISYHNLAERLGSVKATRTVDPDNKCNLETFFEHFPTLEEITQFTIESALTETNQNQSQAAKLLGISKQALNKRINNKGRSDKSNN